MEATGPRRAERTAGRGMGAGQRGPSCLHHLVWRAGLGHLGWRLCLPSPAGSALAPLHWKGLSRAGLWSVRGGPAPEPGGLPGVQPGRPLSQVGPAAAPQPPCFWTSVCFLTWAPVLSQGLNIPEKCFLREMAPVHPTAPRIPSQKPNSCCGHKTQVPHTGAKRPGLLSWREGETPGKQFLGPRAAPCWWFAELRTLLCSWPSSLQPKSRPSGLRLGVLEFGGPRIPSAGRFRVAPQGDPCMCLWSFNKD